MNMQIKAKGLLKWIFGSLIIETNHISFICWSCGRKLGRIEYIGKTPTFDVVNTLCICRDCWDKCKAAGIKEIDWQTVTFP